MEECLEGENDRKPVSPDILSPTSSNNEVDSVVSEVDSILLADDVDHRFELRDINVRFPEGQLSLITGPTASGKTALLVRRFFLFLILWVCFKVLSRWPFSAR